MYKYKSKYFSAKELIHPQIISQIGINNAYMRLDYECLMDYDTIREAWEDKVKSTWPEENAWIYMNSGDADSRGLRPPNDPDGSFYSTHKMGTTADMVPDNGRHEEFWHMVWTMIKSKKLRVLNTMEDRSYTPSWTHVAKMNHNRDILIIKP